MDATVIILGIVVDNRIYNSCFSGDLLIPFYTSHNPTVYELQVNGGLEGHNLICKFMI